MINKGCLLQIAYDPSDYDDTILMVAKINRNKVYIINEFRNDEANELFFKLIGKEELHGVRFL